jgi:tocopherol O-methyltransferase
MLGLSYRGWSPAHAQLDCGRSNIVSTSPQPAVDGELNRTVAQYYDSTVELYEGLWNEHIHHGFWDPDDSSTADRHAASDRTVRELAALAGFPAGSYVLDAGCGIGGPALILARELDCRVEGVTLSSQQAQRAAQRAAAAGLADRTVFRQMDALHTDYADGSFDVVWALESLEHMPDRSEFFAEALRVLRPGGTLAVSTWFIDDGELGADGQALLNEIYERQAIPSLQSLATYERLCRAAGFIDVVARDWTRYVRRTYDTEFTGVEPLNTDRSYIRNLARSKGVEVLRFFYASPLMNKAYDTGVMHYGALRATKPAGG